MKPGWQRTEDVSRINSPEEPDLSQDATRYKPVPGFGLPEPESRTCDFCGRGPIPGTLCDECFAYFSIDPGFVIPEPEDPGDSGI